MNPKSRRLDEGQHQFQTPAGEEDRIVLIEWLNSAVGSKSYQRVTRLIQAIQSCTAAGDAAVHDGAYFQVGKPEELLKKAQERREIDRLLGRVQIPLKAYVFRPRLTFLMFGGRRWWLDLVGDPVAGDFRYTRSGGRRVYEADAVFGILRLASYGFLDRVRQCLSCRKWIYARPTHKKYCSEKCQLKCFAATPQQKEKRAEYMRRYRVENYTGARMDRARNSTRHLRKSDVRLRPGFAK